MSHIAPVAIFCYVRLDHLKRTINALLANDLAKETDAYIFSDGARSEKDIPVVNELREYLKTIEGFKSIKIVERPQNVGLNNNIQGGISEVLENNDRVIVIEDDIVTSPYFLKYVNDGLEKYQDNPKVGAIQGYQYPIDTKGLPQTVFKLGCSCWGWATWKRAWILFEDDGKRLLETLKKQGKGPLMSKLFEQCLISQAEGKAQAWDVCWAASLMAQDMVSLTPTKSMTQNIGCDNSGTQCTTVDEDSYTVDLCDYEITEFNEVVEDNKIVRQKILDFFKDREERIKIFEKEERQERRKLRRKKRIEAVKKFFKLA